MVFFILRKIYYSLHIIVERSYVMTHSSLFSSIIINGLRLPNRIVMSPMCMYSSEEDGIATDFHYAHYVSRAVGQVGLVMLEATAVTAQGRISSHDLGIWNDGHIPGLAKIVEGIHASGAKAAIQLAHAGRKGMSGTHALTPSAVQYNKNMKNPEIMTLKHIEETVDSFKKGAVRAKKAGFDFIEIHGAHGYLINEFLSPLTNLREDNYGGEKENRYRFLSEIIEAVRMVWEGPLSIRLSTNEYDKNGNDMSTFITFSQWMKDQGVDVIDCSSGAVVPATIQVYPGYQVPYAEKIRWKAGIMTAAVGQITSGIQAEEIIRNGRADLVFIGKALLRDPYWPRTAAQELNVSLPSPEQYVTAW